MLEGAVRRAAASAAGLRDGAAAAWTGEACARWLHAAACVARPAPAATAAASTQGAPLHCEAAPSSSAQQRSAADPSLAASTSQPSPPHHWHTTPSPQLGRQPSSGLSNQHPQPHTCHSRAPSLSASSSHLARPRAYATLTRTGVPQPRPEVEQAMSTHHGGHISRSLKMCTTVAQLAGAVQKHQASLAPLHLALIALKLEKLVQLDRSPATALHVQLLARAVEQGAVSRAPWLTAWHIATVVRGLTCVSYKLQHASLTTLAAALTADGCARLRVENAPVWRDVAYGFAMQDYHNPLFWDRVCEPAAGLVAQWRGPLAVSFLRHVAIMCQPSAELVRAAAESIGRQVGSLSSSDIADALYALVKLAGPQYPARASQQALQGAGAGSSSPGAGPGAGAAAVPGAAAGGAPAPAHAATAAPQPPPYPQDLLQRLRGTLVPALRDAGLAWQGGWDGKSLALFARSLAHLRAGGPGAGDALAQRAQACDFQPLYALKMVQACAAMGCASPGFYESMASKAHEGVRHAAPELRQKLVRAFVAVPAAAGLQAVDRLVAHVGALSGRPQQRGTPAAGAQGHVATASSGGGGQAASLQAA